jgi:hypothetical protein
MRSSLLLSTVAAALLTVAAIGEASAAPAPRPPAQESLVELLPARAKAGAILRRNGIAPFRDMLGTDAEMLRELSNYLDRSLGIDLTKLEGAAVFTTDVLNGNNLGVGIIVRIASTSTSAIKLPVAGDAGGTPMYRVDKDVYCARTKYGLVLGNEAELRLAVAVAMGREPALKSDSGLGRLLATDPSEVDAVVAVGPGGLPALPMGGVDDAILTYRHNGTVEIALHGDPNQLAILRTAAQTGEQMALQNMAGERDKATATMDPWKGAGGIVTYYQLKRIFAELEPKLDGKTLYVRYALPSTGSSSLIYGALGLGIGVSIESVQKYLAKSKASEAKARVSSMAMSVMAWANADGHKPSMLKSTELAPAARCCGQADNKCVAEPKSFAGPTWKALGISIDEASRYQYRIVVDAKRKPATITVEARGDLDCDGKPSSFHRTVTFGANGPELGALESQDEDE